jgi:hypothetical protein
MRPIAIDATTLSIMLNPMARVPVDLGRERLNAFIAKAEKERRKLVIPTPATAELLTAIGPNSADYIRVINRKAVFEVKAFDEVAAMELAFLNRDVFASLDKKNKLEGWQKIKVDRQIIAIAKVAECEQILTEDEALGNRARLCDIEPIKLADLPIPDSAKQGVFDLEEHEEIADLDRPEAEEGADGGQ